MEKKTPKINGTPKSTAKKIYRSEDNRILAGVAGGIGEFFTIDPVWIRIIFILITLWGGGGLIIYLLLWLIIPGPNSIYRQNRETIKSNIAEIKNQTKEYTQKVKNAYRKERRFWLGFILIISGSYLILVNFNFLKRVIDFSQLWPIVLIGLGLGLIFQKDN